MLQKLLQYKYQIAATVVVVVIIAVLWYWWKKKDQTTIEIVDDNGNPVTPNNADLQKAASIAQRLFNTIDGVTFSQDWDAYQELSEQSNTVFALTFKTYQEKYNRSLLTDIQGEWAWSNIINIIVNRATALNLQ